MKRVPCYLAGLHWGTGLIEMKQAGNKGNEVPDGAVTKEQNDDATETPGPGDQTCPPT